MATYSKYIGQTYESLSSTLILSATSPYGFTNEYVLTDVYDNQSKSVRPKNIRDMILSAWDSNAFKETTASGSAAYYIGIDTGNADSAKDIKGQKILIGKRSQQSTQIMTSSLLSSNADLFFFNTKKDTQAQANTKVVFLSGKDANLHTSSPYLQTNVVTTGTGTQSLSLDIVAPIGDISFLSRGIQNGEETDTGGTVSVNNIVFPTYDSSYPYFGGSASDGKVLIYRSGKLEWEDLTLPNNDYIGTTGSSLGIYGKQIRLNDYPLEFTETMYIPREIGDVRLGATFDGESITKLLEKIIYAYLPPLCTLSLSNSNGYVEIGTYPQITLDYTITKRTNATQPTRLINMLPTSYPAISDYGHIVIEGSTKGIVISPMMATSSVFKIKVSDGVSSNSASVSVTGIYPYFYGFTASNTISTSLLRGFEKIIEPKANKILDLTGSENFYFIYDASYGMLSSILDSFGNNIISSFSVSTNILSSPTGLWASKPFIVYKLSGVSQIGPPSENFEFRH